MQLDEKEREVFDLLNTALNERLKLLETASKNIGEIETIKRQVNNCRWLVIGSLALSGLTFIMNGFYLDSYRTGLDDIREEIRNAPQLATRAECRSTNPNVIQQIFGKVPETICNSETSPK